MQLSTYDPFNDHKKYDFYFLLLSINIVFMAICDVVAMKVITFGSFSISASGFLFPLVFIINSIISEIYGYKLAGKAVWLILLAQFIFTLIISVVVHFKNSSSAIDSSYYLLFSNFWRISIGGTFSIFLAYFGSNYLLSKMKITLIGKYFILRLLISNGIGKFLLVFTAYPVNYYGIFSFSHIMKISLDTWIYKMIFLLIASPLTLYFCSFLKNKVHLDIFDFDISYNPLNVFKFSKNNGVNFFKQPLSRNHFDA